MLKELEEAIYNEFDIKVKAINSAYNSDENSYLIVVKIPKPFTMFINAIHNFIFKYFPYMMYCEKFDYLVVIDE